MTTIRTTLPPAAPPLGVPDDPTPAPVSIDNGGGIEGIVLELENQSRRARALRNDARDARRMQQASSIRETREGARWALAGTLVTLVAETAGSVASSARSGGDAGGAEGQGAAPDTPAPGGVTPDAAVRPTASAEGNTPPGDASASPGPINAGSQRQPLAQAAVGVGELGGTLLGHQAKRAEARAQVDQHAAQVYEDVAEDAAQAAQDATRMSERALQHLDAILAARRDAEAAILRA